MTKETRAKKPTDRYQVDRLSNVIERSPYNQSQFADRVGMSQSGLSTLLMRRVGVSKTLAYAVEARIGVSAVWILTGKGEPKFKAKTYTEGYNDGYADGGKNALSLLAKALDCVD